MKCCDANFSASKFNKQIVIQSLSLVANDSGGQDETWTTFVTVWASITPKIVREINFAQRIEPRVDHIIRMRYYPGILASMRVSYESRIFEIKAIINVEEEDEYLEILATERSGT